MARRRNQPVTTELVGRLLEQAYADIRDRMRERLAMITLAAVVFTGLLPFKQLAIAGPVIIFFLALDWYRNDKRIGEAANYIRKELGPVIQKETGVVDYETYLDRIGARGSGRRFRALSIIAKLFPLMQCSLLAYGTYFWASTWDGNRQSALLAGSGIVLGVITTLVTIATVKHVRPY